MARSLCAGNHLQYLSIANIGFRVVRDAAGPGFQLEHIDRLSSEADEAEIFNLMRV